MILEEKLSDTRTGSPKKDVAKRRCKKTLQKDVAKRRCNRNECFRFEFPIDSYF
jgi:hypothetical protein